MIQTEMEAFAGQINLKLLNDIVSFVLRTADAGWAQKEELERRCIFPIQTSGAAHLQQEYGFLYLGELLERYEERFGMTPQDRRAIALALGYTRDIVAPEMFVGDQRRDFIQAVDPNAQGDIYLTGALYLLHEGQDGVEEWETQLKNQAYTRTEELVFAMSLFQDQEAAFDHFKPQLLRLLGKERTVPVLGNGELFKWVIAMLFSRKKTMRAKNLAPLRALTALATSYVKEDSKPYGYLREHGYTPLEIAYANAAALCGRCVSSSPNRDSITAEKTVIALFRTVLGHEKVLSAEVYGQLDGLYTRYSRFEVKCYGVRRLEETLRDGPRIQTPETMAWFIGHESVYHPAVDSFDIMDVKWNPLAASLKPEDYRKLFELNLTEAMDAGELRRRIDRYHALTGKNYLDCYSTDSSGSRFSLLVKAGVIDLWTAFQDSFAPDGTVARPSMLAHIGHYVSDVLTIQAFDFMKRFLPKYGYGGVKQYLDRYNNGFENKLWKQRSYNGDGIVLTIRRDYLANDLEGQLLMLHWVEEYFFTQIPKQYPLFIQAVLEDEAAAALLSAEDRRGLFDLVIGQSELSRHDAARLKQRYQTPEEQMAEQVAAEMAKAEEKRQEHLELVQSIETDYQNTADGTMKSVHRFLDHYRYYKERSEIAARVAHDGLEPLLQGKGYLLDRSEADWFLRVCGNLLSLGAMDWAEVQTRISTIKEAAPNDPDCDSAA